MKNILTLLLSIIIIGFAGSQTINKDKQKAITKKDTVLKNKTIVAKQVKSSVLKDTVNKNKTLFANQESSSDSLFVKTSKLKPFKNDARASYYADKFNGKKTTSGIRFDNNKYTAAHKKLPFGTRVKVTNPTNGKSVIVEVNDRGPFVKSREIDLSKRAFMEIASNKSTGVMKVNLELIQK
jgi:rare lipoprotein A